MIGLASAFSGSVLQAHSELFLVNNEKGPLDWARELLGVAKGLTSLEVRLDNAPSVTFLNLHTHPTSRSVRVAQILQLIDFTLFAIPTFRYGNIAGAIVSLLTASLIVLRLGADELRHGHGVAWAEEHDAAREGSVTIGYEPPPSVERNIAASSTPARGSTAAGSSPTAGACSASPRWATR